MAAGRVAYARAAGDGDMLPVEVGELKVLDERRPHQRFAAAALAACVVCCGVVAAMGLSSTSVASPHPLTVRGLLESPELTELATDNMMSMGKDVLAPLGRDTVRAHVARRLLNISDTIRQRLPDAHRQMDGLQLSDAQKGSVLQVLRHYGDARLLSISDDITDAVRETVLAKGDHAALKRRLSEKLQPRLGEMRGLVEEMFPGSGKHFAFDVEQIPVVHRFAQWHPTSGEADPLGAQLAPEAPNAGRRLRSAEEVDGGVQAQAQTLFQALESTLGDKMPKAPARMLSFFDEGSPAPPNSNAAPGKAAGDESFMKCLIEAVPNPMSVMACISKNMQEVFHMLMKFVSGKPSEPAQTL